MQSDLLREQENLKKRQADILNNMQKEFENEKQQRKEKFSMKISKFMDSGQSFDELNDGDEKREIAVISFKYSNSKLIFFSFH
jgi:hypothetical protein